MKESSMAKKKAAQEGEDVQRSVNKSEAVRRYAAEHPEAMPRQIADALNQEGLDVTAQFVSQIKYQSKLTGPRTSSRSRGRANKARGRKLGPLTADELMQVKTLLERLGGEARLAEALDVLRQLQ